MSYKFSPGDLITGLDQSFYEVFIDLMAFYPMVAQR